MGEIGALGMPFSRFWMRACGAVLLALVLGAAVETLVELGEGVQQRVEESAAAAKTCADVLNTKAGGSTCGARIKWVKNNKGKSDVEAKAVVSSEFPTECGACKPKSVSPTSAPTFAPTWHRPFPSNWNAHFPSKIQACSCCKADKKRMAQNPDAPCFWKECGDVKVKDTTDQQAQIPTQKYCWNTISGPNKCSDAEMLQACESPPKPMNKQDWVNTGWAKGAPDAPNVKPKKL